MADVVLTLMVTLADGAAVVVVPDTEPIPAVAVTFAVLLVVSVVRARPSASVVSRLGETLPASVVNVTRMPVNALPLESNTDAVIVELPPVADTVVGLAARAMFPTAAAPTAIFSAPLAPTVAPPDAAIIVAVPDAPPAMNFTVARPLMSVSASEGSILPSDVVKLMCVPACGGVPAGSMT